WCRPRLDHRLASAGGAPSTDAPALAAAARPAAPRRPAARTAMIRVLDARQLGVEAVVAALARPPATIPSEILRAVDAILTDVRARGDAALLELTARFDGFTGATPTELVITPDEFEMAERQVAPDVRAALAYAAERIERYHAVGAPKSWRLTDEHGSVLGQEVRPLDRGGIYA